MFTFLSSGDVLRIVGRGLSSSGGAETVSASASLFGSGKGEGECWVIGRFSFGSCISLETGLDVAATSLGAFPSTWTTTGTHWEDPESSRSNICLGLAS